MRSLSITSLQPKAKVKALAAAIGTVLCVGVIWPVMAGNAPGRQRVASNAAVVADTSRVHYTILLSGEPLATYHGGVAGYPAPARIQSGNKIGRLDVQAPTARAYVDYLAQRQAAFVRDLAAAIGRPLDPVATMQHALNAVVVDLDESEAALASRRSDVVLVERERELQLHTERSPTFIGATQVWDGSVTGDLPSQGEGIIVADLDTGINWESPAFAAVGPIDGYAHVNPNGAGNYLGLCGPTPPNADLGHCNDKLIGMYDFTSSAATRSATDLDGHGSHTASTIAGNHWHAPFGGGTFTISGVAPHANVIAYRVCTSGCSSSASSQAVNQAIIDGVDVINYSISGGVSPWNDSVSIAFRNAVGAGLFVAASAGNDGPDAGSVNHVEPWVETVAASTKDDVVGFRFDLTGPGTPPAGTQGLPLRPAAPPLPTASIVNAPIVRSPDFDDGSNDGCSAYPAGTFTALGQPQPPAEWIFGDGFDPAPAPVETGAIAVLALDQNASNCASGTRRAAALAAGAIGVIFVDRDFINLGASDTSWSMLRADWDQAWAQIQTDPAAATASLLLPAAAFPQRGDVVSDYSSRGPHANSGQYLVKPDVTAPGTDILAAYAAEFGGATATAMENGTSMSSPHTTGAAALVRAVRPDWTPMQVRSALSMTAKLDGLERADGSAVNPFDLGSGRIDLSRATNAGLLLDESVDDFVAANPASGGDLSSLNLPSLASANCATTCSFTRHFSGALAGTHTYTIAAAGLVDGAVTIEPQQFSVDAGAIQDVTITINGALLASDWNYGGLEISGDGGMLVPLYLPIAVLR